MTFLNHMEIYNVSILNTFYLCFTCFLLLDRKKCTMIEQTIDRENVKKRLQSMFKIYLTCKFWFFDIVLNLNYNSSLKLQYIHCIITLAVTQTEHLPVKLPVQTRLFTVWILCWIGDLKFLNPGILNQTHRT